MNDDPHRFAKLAGSHPDLTRAVRAVVLAMRELGHHMIVTDGIRTISEQQALYAKGRTAPGPIVTRADGINVRSNHQPHNDGKGHAVDCCFLVDGTPSWAESNPWDRYGALARAVGLKWGGDWTTPDRPHIELPEVIA